MCAKNIDAIDTDLSTDLVDSSDVETVTKSAGLTDSDVQQITNIISGYNIMLSQYEKLKADLNETCGYIDNGNLSLGNALKAFSQSYSINGVSADSGKLESVIKDVNGTKSYLMTVVMPAIDFEIDDLKKRIAELQTQLQ